MNFVGRRRPAPRPPGPAPARPRARPGPVPGAGPLPGRRVRRSGRRGSLCGEPVRRRAGGAWGVRVRWPQHRRRAAGGGGGGGPAAISRISRARAWASCGWWTRAAPTCAQQQPCACKGPSPSPPLPTSRTESSPTAYRPAPPASEFG